MNNLFIIKLCLILLSSLFFGFLINKLFLKFSKTLGIRNIDNQVIRWNTTAKPSLGGISFFIVFLLILVQYSILFNNTDHAFNIQLIGVLTASSLGFLMGLADDAYNTNPLLKSIAQGICAIILIATGTYIHIFDNEWLNYALTFLWVVGLMNSINMLDNMDGISTVAAISALLAMLIVLYFQHKSNYLYFSLMLGMIGALIGFLYFNWHPSKIYMGDTGSQFLGVSLAAFSIIVLWNFQFDSPTKSTSLQFLLPLLAFIVPLSDTLTVVINRIRAGTSPFVGGKDHTTHHLTYLGFSETSVTLIVGGIGFVSTIFILIAISIINWIHIYTILFGLYAFSLFLSLFLITRFNNKNAKPQQHEPKERKINSSL